MLNALLLVLRGHVCLFQGQELGLSQVDITFDDLQDPAAITGWPHYKGRDGCRTPMPWDADADFAGFSQIKPWLPIGSDHAEMAVNKQSKERESILAHTIDTITFRNQRSALRSGKIEFVEAGDDHLVFQRSDGLDTWICAFNFSDRTIELDILDTIDDGTDMLMSHPGNTRSLSADGYLIARKA